MTAAGSRRRSAWDAQLTNLVGAVTLALADQMSAATDDVAGLGAAGPAALVALAEFAGGRSIEQLRDVLGLTHSGCVRLVDRLAAAELARRVPGPDRRTVRIELTKTGRSTARRVRDARWAAIEPALATLRVEERRRLHELIAKVAAAITEQRLAERAEGRTVDGWMCRMCDFSACGRQQGRCPVANHAAATTTAR